MKSRQESASHPGGVPRDQIEASRRGLRNSRAVHILVTPTPREQEEVDEEGPGILNITALPLVRDGERVGVLFVNYHQRPSFTREEQDALRAYATQVAAVMDSLKRRGV